MQKWVKLDVQVMPCLEPAYAGSASAPSMVRENLYPENRLNSAKIPSLKECIWMTELLKRWNSWL
jgi:hypothetical protein